ncbi:hypothetical protein Hypma_000744 [Hypsizygus marmoreus]|uniref:Uncharacterized protein n=1 Tax=Hypsizygus marmoreus TaxID=39966 RepID=A0A369JF06_HYPMA|nr:hypothetical protein Hypma_000744 [Hypsizygus marmoreus]
MSSGLKAAETSQSPLEDTRRLFAIDLALIALSVRTGYLVDVVSLLDPVEIFSQLLCGLRSTCPEFENVVHVYEATSGQSFFVNKRLLLEHGGPSAYLHRTSFVQLHTGSPFNVLVDPPTALERTLQSLIDNGTTSQLTSITLPSELTPEMAIPLAAVLLEYPVAYVPSSLSQSSFLSNVPLDVYECVLTFNGRQTVLPSKHTLLKFSCPSELGKEHPDRLGNAHVTVSLKEKFKHRLQSSGIGASLEVLQNCQTLDRVAL